MSVLLVSVYPLYSSNCQVKLSVPNVYWGDLHAHSGLSFDATGSIDSFYVFARDVAKLDFVCASDHDIRSSEEKWTTAKRKANYYNKEGRFVTLIGYEWTAPNGNFGGHRIVYFRNDDPPRYGVYLPSTSSIQTLTAALKEVGGIMHIAHPDWFDIHADTLKLDDSVQVGIEFFGWGGYRFEYYGNPNRASNQIRGYSVQNFLMGGHRLGAIGVGDNHTSRPGLGGLTAVHADTLTREAIFDAIKRRRTHASTGARINLDFRCGDLLMGEVGDDSLGDREFSISVSATHNISEVAVIRNSETVFRANSLGTSFYSHKYKEDYFLRENAYYYLRVIQEDGHIAWSSPIFFTRSLVTSVRNSSSMAAIQVFPSPATDFIHIRYSIPVARDITIGVYDVLGRKVKTVHFGTVLGGPYQVSIRMNDLANGIYAVRLEGETVSLAAKVILLR